MCHCWVCILIKRIQCICKSACSQKVCRNTVDLKSPIAKGFKKVRNENFPIARLKQRPRKSQGAHPAPSHLGQHCSAATHNAGEQQRRPRQPGSPALLPLPLGRPGAIGRRRPSPHRTADARSAWGQQPHNLVRALGSHANKIMQTTSTCCFRRVVLLGTVRKRTRRPP